MVVYEKDGLAERNSAKLAALFTLYSLLASLVVLLLSSLCDYVGQLNGTKEPLFARASFWFTIIYIASAMEGMIW